MGGGLTPPASRVLAKLRCFSGKSRFIGTGAGPAHAARRGCAMPARLAMLAPMKIVWTQSSPILPALRAAAQPPCRWTAMCGVSNDAR
jgi:hypothetical protein